MRCRSTPVSVSSVLLLTLLSLGGGRSAASPIDTSAALQRWEAVYDHNSPHADDGVVAKTVRVSPDGSRVFVTGSGRVSSDFHTVAYDGLTGAELWSASYDGPSAPGGSYDDHVSDLVLSPDGSRVYVSGWSQKACCWTGPSDFATVAYDALTGSEIWIARYRSSAGSREIARDMVISPDGTRLFITGDSGDPASGDSHFLTVAYEASSGTRIWATSELDLAEGSHPTAITIGPSGMDLFVTGASGYRPYEMYQSTDIETISYKTVDGSKTWAMSRQGHTYGYERALDIVVNPSGDRVFVGGTDLVAYDAGTGAESWASNLHGTFSSGATVSDIATSLDGSKLYAVAWGQSAANNAVVMAFEPATGRMMWETPQVGLRSPSRPPALEPSLDGRWIYVTGAGGSTWPRMDMVTAAYETTTGAESWTNHYPGVSRDPRWQRDAQATALAVSPDGRSLYVAGWSERAGRSFYPYMTTVAYRADVKLGDP